MTSRLKLNLCFTHQSIDDCNSATEPPLVQPRGLATAERCTLVGTFRRARARLRAFDIAPTQTQHTRSTLEGSPTRYLTAVAIRLSTTFKGSLAVSQHTQKQTSPTRYQNAVNNAQRRDISDMSLSLLTATHAAMTVVALYPRISALPIDHRAKDTWSDALFLL